MSCLGVNELRPPSTVFCNRNFCNQAIALKTRSRTFSLSERWGAARRTKAEKRLSKAPMNPEPDASIGRPAEPVPVPPRSRAPAKSASKPVTKQGVDHVPAWNQRFQTCPVPALLPLC